MNAIRILLSESIDYAGLFPPAELDMGTALNNYAQYLVGPSSWALGRFIVPVSRLAELEVALQRIPSRQLELPRRFAALLGKDVEEDVQLLEAFNRHHSDRGATIDSVEVKATSENSIGAITRVVPASFETYIEIPIDREPGGLIAAIGQGGRRAKVRTGGVTQDAFPPTADLVRFLREAAHRGVPFKATAGLHHPLRAAYRLTYAEGGPSGTMFGFLNLLLAVAFLRSGMKDPEVAQVLEEGEPDGFQADDSGITWRKRFLDLKVLGDMRRLGMISFGSCSFTEPLSDLEALHLLPLQVRQA
ncbi:MAG: hypothetical protein H0T58_02040 [Gemmatimonadales bacterium]|nr:hypothetical protein [Gemmatimonadales bacterium]